MNATKECDNEETMMDRQTLDQIMSVKWAIRDLVDHCITQATVAQIRRACDVYISPSQGIKIVCLGYEEFRSENDETFTVTP